MKTGRNAPCPCGSGKKYKKCCLHKDEADDFLYSRISQCYNSLIDKMLDFVYAEMRQGILNAAMDDFLFQDKMEDNEYYLLLNEFSQLISHWSLFVWNIEKEDYKKFDGDIQLPANATIADLYMRKMMNKIDSMEKTIIQSVSGVPFSFYEISSVASGVGFTCHDILTGQTKTVSEHKASSYLDSGDILFGSIAQVLDIEMLLGASPIKFSLSRKPEIIDLRSSIKEECGVITEDVLKKYDIEMRSVFLDMYERASRPPLLVNTDGDTILLLSLHYAIEDSEEAFEALHHLCPVETREELLTDAQFDDFGKLISIDLSWVRIEPNAKTNMDNTVLGSISINGNKMIVSVNSAERASNIIEIIKELLGKKAKLLETKNEAMSSKKTDDQEDALAFHEMVMQDPQARRKLENFYLEHWKKWVDFSLPALNGATPREAVKTPEGREKVDALLRDIAAKSISGMELQGKGIEYARKKLGF